jgi:hypothetical protein
MRRFLRENGLSLALFALFLLSLIGQSVAGWRTFSEDQQSHGGHPLSYTRYLTSGHFVEAVFENWESEFLQMAAFVLMTVALRQKGSSESKPLSEEASSSRTRPSRRKDAPLPVRRGGWLLRLYENSLTIALALLFLLSFSLHALGGAAEENRERILHGDTRVSLPEYVGSSKFWFESFQNWQSEFLSVGVLIVLSIFLRQKGSPQSKEVAEPHAKTGAD